MKKSLWLLTAIGILVPSSLPAKTNVVEAVSRRVTQQQLQQDPRYERLQLQLTNLRELVGTIQEEDVPIIMQRVLELADAFFDYAKLQFINNSLGYKLALVFFRHYYFDSCLREILLHIILLHCKNCAQKSHGFKAFRNSLLAHSFWNAHQISFGSARHLVTDYMHGNCRKRDYLRACRF